MKQANMQPLFIITVVSDTKNKKDVKSVGTNLRVQKHKRVQPKKAVPVYIFIGLRKGVRIRSEYVS